MKFKRGISLLYHGCYCSNHGINIYTMVAAVTAMVLWGRFRGVCEPGLPR